MIIVAITEAKFLKRYNIFIGLIETDSNVSVALNEQTFNEQTHHCNLVL